MRDLSITSVAVLAVLPLLACLELAPPAQAQVADPCQGLREWGLFVDGEPADELVARTIAEEGVEAFVRNQPPEGLGIDMNIGELTALVRRIDQEPTQVVDVPEQLQGIGGFSTVLLLKKLLRSDDEPIADEVVYGKIRDYTFVEGTVEGTGSGHMSVDMCIDRREFVPLGEDRREFYHWDIEILEDGFTVAERVDPSDPADPGQYNNPFPTLNFPLPEQATDPANPGSIWRRGLDHKLHAKGESIRVRHIYHRRLTDPDLMRLPDGHHFYNSTPESCVDLFTEGPPPGTFGELVDNDYCLGRCEHPNIVNTGG
jgi:hypothetical protein